MEPPTRSSGARRSARRAARGAAGRRRSARPRRHPRRARRPGASASRRSRAPSRRGREWRRRRGEGLRATTVPRAEGRERTRERASVRAAATSARPREWRRSRAGRRFRRSEGVMNEIFVGASSDKKCRPGRAFLPPQHPPPRVFQRPRALIGGPRVARSASAPPHTREARASRGGSVFDPPRSRRARPGHPLARRGSAPCPRLRVARRRSPSRSAPALCPG